MSEPAVVQLPRGRHKLSRDEVTSSQRGRMLTGMVQAVAERGYARATVADVIRRAGVSRETFYAHFADKEACFLAAYDAGVEDILRRMSVVRDEAAQPTSPAQRFERLLGAYLQTLADEPAFARAFLIEIYAVGPPALARRIELQSRFVDAIVEVLGARAKDRFACDALVAAIVALVTARVGMDDFDGVVALRKPVMGLLERGLGS
jgi:AcrR family transcriptional regulator